jgi:hypothetical protein
MDRPFLLKCSGPAGMALLAARLRTQTVFICSQSN